MAPTTALTTKVASGSPYQLAPEQTLKASKALLAHLKDATVAQPEAKKSLITDADSEDEDSSDSPVIWLNLTTKQHIIDKKRLKPAKIHLPHALNTSPTTTICLITADPQRTYKDVVASPAFPAALSKRITKVVGFEKIKKKFSQYEAQRKLFAEHDIFLADDRIISQLPQFLGKTFYKSTAKRPIPVSIQAPAPKKTEKDSTKAKSGGKTGAGEPKAIAAEIEKAIQSALVHLSPSVSTSVRVGYASMKPEALAQNVEAVVTEMVEKFVPKKWRGVKSVYIKGAATAALPIWLADELWVDEDEVLSVAAAQKLDSQKPNVGKKRKVVDAAAAEEAESKKQKLLLEGNDDKVDQVIAASRKEKLRKQKEAAAKEVGADDVPTASKQKRAKAA